MPKSTTFVVYGYIERHYRIEVEAESYDEAEMIGHDMINNSEPSALYDYDNGKHTIIGDVECEDPEWDEEEETA